MNEICVECNDSPKAPNAYLYCKECRDKLAKISKKKSSQRTQAKRRMKNYSKCEECKDRFTYTKYCKSCSQTVHRRQCRERVRKKRDGTRGTCERCKTEEKWSVDNNTKYCYSCKAAVKRERELKKQKQNKTEENRDRKKPIHKGVKLDPTMQQPTLDEPLKTENGGINPYFLRRRSE